MCDQRTAKYIIRMTIIVMEQNQYGDEIGQGALTYCAESKAKDLTQLGLMLGAVQAAIQNDPTG